MNISQKYAKTEVSGLSQVELESRALIKTASRLNRIKENWEQNKSDLVDALEENRRLWTIFAGAIEDKSSPLPIEIQRNILSLAIFIFKKTINILANPAPDGLGVLIEINMSIARGLTEHE